MQNYRTQKQIDLEEAKERVQKIKKLYKHIAFLSFGIFLYILKTYFGAPFNFFPINLLNATVLWCWIFIVVVKGIKLLILEGFFGSKWEKKQIDKVMQNDSSNSNKWE